MASATHTEDVEKVENLTKPSFLCRVRIRGFKSIAFCDVSLEPLTILVGRNASGKSNFLDALAFLRDVMAEGAPDAVRRRGGWSSVVCRTSLAQNIQIEVQTRFTCGGPYWRNGPNGFAASTAIDKAPNLTGATFAATYKLEIAVGPHSSPIVSREMLQIIGGTHLDGGFEVENGVISRELSIPHPPAEPLALPHSRELLSLARPDKPLLGQIGVQPIIDLWAGLRSMAFYNFIPEAMRRPQKLTPAQLLDQSGWNLATVLASTRKSEEWVFERLGSYLSAVVPPIERFELVQYGEYWTIRFRLCTPKPDQKLEFDAANMSDGTLRVLAALTAAFQNVPPHGSPSVVGIEEPESALHPAAMRVLVDALDEATLHTQVLLTTHSADMLDASAIRPENIRVVQMIDGQTVIAPVDAAGVEIVRRKLNTLGGLERDNLLEPDLDDLNRQRQLSESRAESPA